MLKSTIRPEFLNRIDEIILFTPLTKKDIHNVVRLQLDMVTKTLAASGIVIEATDYAIDWIATTGYDPQFGARPVKRVIQRSILNELSKQILAGKVKKDAVILIDVFDNHVVFRNAKVELGKLIEQ